MWLKLGARIGYRGQDGKSRAINICGIPPLRKERAKMGHPAVTSISNFLIRGKWAEFCLSPVPRKLCRP